MEYVFLLLALVAMCRYYYAMRMVGRVEAALRKRGRKLERPYWLNIHMPARLSELRKLAADPDQDDDVRASCRMAVVLEASALATFLAGWVMLGITIIR